jgi:hypothetical protein
MAPGLAISPLAGALIDRVGSVWAITVDMAASAACVAALIAADRLDWASAPVLLVLTGLFSLSSPLSMAGIRALLPRLVPATALDRANALDTAVHGLTDIVGPATAGAMVGYGGPMLALGTIAIGFAAAALCIARLRQPRGRFPRAGPLLSQAWSGLLRVVRQPTLRGLAHIRSGNLVGHPARGRAGVPRRASSPAAGAAIAGLLWAVGLVGGIAALIAATEHRGTGTEGEALGMLATAVAVWPIVAEFGLIGLVLGMMLVGRGGPIDVGAGPAPAPHRSGGAWSCLVRVDEFELRPAVRSGPPSQVHWSPGRCRRHLLRLHWLPCWQPLPRSR